MTAFLKLIMAMSRDSLSHLPSTWVFSFIASDCRHAAIRQGFGTQRKLRTRTIPVGRFGRLARLNTRQAFLLQLYEVHPPARAPVSSQQSVRLCWVAQLGTDRTC